MTLTGIVAAAVTPMTNEGAALASRSTFEAYYRFLLERQVSGLLIAGTTGEGPLLSLSERKTLAEYAVGIVSHSVPVLVQVGAGCTAESIELARHAEATQADGITVVAPSFYTYDQLALADYFTSVARSVPRLPVYLYNLPAFTHNPILPQLLTEVQRACPNVVGMKHSDADMVRLQEFRRLAGPNFCLLSGDDAMEYGALALGADGCVSGKSSCFPEVTTALYRAFRSGDLAAARRQQTRIDLLATILDLGVGIDLAHFKAAMAWRGLSLGSVRPPQRQLLRTEEQAMRRGLEELQRQGVLDDLRELQPSSAH